MPIEILTLSTNGELILPKNLRKDMSLLPGNKLIAYWSNGCIDLKKLELPLETSFEEEVDETVAFARETGIKKQDIVDAIKKYRAKEKAR